MSEPLLTFQKKVDVLESLVYLALKRVDVPAQASGTSFTFSPGGPKAYFAVIRRHRRAA